MFERDNRGTAHDMRSFLSSAHAAGLLDIVDGPVDLADIAQHLDGAERAVYFSKVGPEGAKLVGNVAGSRDLLALAFDTSGDGLLKQVNARLANPKGTREVGSAEAPVQDVVLTGDDADFSRLPIHLQHGLDGGNYVSASTDIVMDQSTGMTNVGMRRLMVRGRREAGVDLIAPSDLRAIYEKCVERGEHLPVAFVIGSHPVDHVAATMRIPVDEVGLMASLRGEDMPVVKCQTNDLMVPADAECILEGYFDSAGYVAPEGPYGEFMGYYGGVKINPVFRLTAITHRRDPIFQTSTISGAHLGRTDASQLMSLRTEVTVWRALETAVREPLNVHATTSSGGVSNVRISLRQRVPGEARNAISAALASLANIKHAFVYDPDIDIFSSEQCDWALATRFQADRDFVVMEGMRTIPLDPSLVGARVGAKAGFDCTMPRTVAASMEAQIPRPPVIEGRRFASVAAALQDGPKTFAELMAAIETRDGRELYAVFDSLHESGRLGRDKSGAWILTD